MVKAQGNRNPRAQHQLAILVGEGAAVSRGQPQYIREVFDDLAATFEEKLVDHLEYRIPWQLLEAVKETHQEDSASGDWRIVDLGCGTGLCGRLFQNYVTDGGCMIGVDLSPKMIEICKNGGMYHELYVEDAHECLSKQNQETLDLVLSADTFIYVGDLEEIFHLCQGIMKREGLFAFSIEELYSDDNGYHKKSQDFKLIKSGRYAQSRQYIANLSKMYHFKILVEHEVIVRKEQNENINGLVYVLKKE
mmetsp:Transcript_12047/g.15755  ORF Transcript_12047/g.15755 Transcript_12047/m.15755 type:complete len:249 (+) Transcript_12047:3-749(+)